MIDEIIFGISVISLSSCAGLIAGAITTKLISKLLVPVLRKRVMALRDDPFYNRECAKNDSL